MINPEELYHTNVIEACQYKYAQTILTTKDLDNLQWAKIFIDNYRKKHRNARMA